MSNFGKTLKELRKERGLTQPELAFWLKVTKNAVYLWESGQRVPNLETVIALADLFEVPYDLLLNPLIVDIKHKPLTR